MGWNLTDLTARTGSPLATPTVRSDLSGNPGNAQNISQHLVYVGSMDNHIHELTFDPGTKKWSHTDLTTTTTSPPPFSSPTGYGLPFFEARSVLYVTGDNDIHQLMGAGGSWQHTDLTTAAAGSQPAGSIPEGYLFPDDQHVVYLGTDNHIHELVSEFGFNTWSHNDLSAPFGGRLFEGSPTGHAFNARRTQHLIYSGSDNHIHELWSSTSDPWRHNDLTAATGAPLTPPGVKSARGYVFEAQLTQHITYPAVDGHIHELRWDLGGWHDADLCVATGAPEWALPGFPTGYVFDAEGTQHVDYVGIDGHIHELWRDSSGWHHNDLTAATGAPKVAGDLTGYVWAFEGSQHVVYVGADSHIIELWWLP